MQKFGSWVRGGAVSVAGDSCPGRRPRRRPPLLAAAQQAAVQAPELSLPCRAARVLIDQGTGTVLYEKNASQRAPIALDHQGDDPAADL